MPSDTEEGESPEAPSVVLITMDRTPGETIFIRSDGMEARLPLLSYPFEQSSRLQRVHFAPDARAVLIETVDGHFVALNLASPDDPAPLAGRPVVYLDQNHWNTLYRAKQHTDAAGDVDELAAGRWLIGLAERDEVVVPRSAQHTQETCQWSNNGERYLLGLTILQVSRGWQMRDPLHIRREELRASLSGHYRRWPTTPPAAITLEGVINSASIEPYEAPSYFPAHLAHLTSQLIAAVVDVDVMLDADVVPSGPQGGWVAKNQALTDVIADRLADRGRRRRVTDLAFLEDTSGEIRTVARELNPTSRQFMEWVEQHLPADVGAMPCLGLYRELLHDRTVAGVRWEPNDLTDMVYLSAAAGHCDHVVAEREACAQLRQGARRLGRHVVLHRSLRDLRERVEGRGWSTAVTSRQTGRKRPRPEHAA